MAIGGLGFSAGLFGFEDYKNSGAFSNGATNTGAAGAVGFGQNSGAVGSVEDPDKVKKAGHRSSPEDCETCKNRKYQDGSDENVSFKAASHISPEQAPSAVRGHEQEHVSNAYKKAAEKGGQVIHAGVSIHTAVCPECGRTYVSGGVTDTVIKYPKDGGKSDDENGKVNAAGGAESGASANSTPGRNGEKENFSI